MISRLRRLRLRIFVPLNLGLFAAAAIGADFPPQVWINPGIYSLHFDRGRNLREDNVGLGAEVLLSRDHGLMAGTIINSDSQRSRYGAYQWRPWHWQPDDLNISAGVIIAALDGYPRMRNGGWFLAALPVVAIEGERLGVNFSVIPTIKGRVHGAAAIQVKLRVW
jgi:hypothetical protein